MAKDTTTPETPDPSAPPAQDAPPADPAAPPAPSTPPAPEEAAPACEICFPAGPPEGALSWGCEHTA